MDFTSAWFLVVMIVVGGAIAVLADNLGRKLGKSRLRVGKLRPRHTAMLFTAITGAVVTLTTVVLVSVLSAEVREWIIEGREAVKRGKAYRNDMISMEAEVRKTQSDLNTMREDLDEQTKRVKSQREQLVRGQQLVGVAESEAAAAESQARAAEANLRDREAKLRALTKQFQEASKGLASVQQKLAQLDANKRQLEANKKQLEANYAKLNDQVEDAYKQERALHQQNMTLEAENERLEKDIGSLTAQINSGVTQLGDLSARIRTQEENLNALMRTASGYREGAIGARIRPVVFNLKQEIARRDIGLSLTYADAEKHVRSTINLAAEEVFRRTNLGIGLREVMEGNYSSNELVGILARRLSDSRGPATVIVRTSTNVFGDEELVPVEVEVRSNPVVFKKGEQLGEVRIPGDQSVEQIIGAITNMLETQVRSKAADARMYGSENPEASIGQVNPAETIKVVNAIHEANRPVRVFAVAKSETRASGPLEIEFRVR